MQILSSNQKTHLWNARKIGVSIIVDPVDPPGFTITQDDIIEGSLSIDRNWTQGDTIEIGCADTAELVFDLDNSDGQWSEIRWEGAQLTVILNIAGEPLQAGIFTVDERPGKLTTMQIRALDHMARFNRPYVPGIAFPATLQLILADVCSQCNVVLYSQSFDNDSYVVDKQPEGEDISCHQIVACVAGLAGDNAFIDHLGRLQLSWYGENQPAEPLEIGPEDRFSYELAESDITVTGVVFRSQDIDYIVGNDDYALVIEDNPLLQKNYENILTALHTKLGGFVYRPYDFSCLGYPHLWPGDVIQQLIDAEGSVICSIITNHTYVLNGNSHLVAKGETETVRGYATGAPFTSSQKRVVEKIAYVEAERKTSAVELATLQLNRLMAGSLGYYETIVGQDIGSSIKYVHDKPALEESTYIWRYSELGFAWTDQGWDGEETVWHYGVTADGSMVARLLSVVGIQAEWIQVGSAEGYITTLTHDTIATTNVLAQNLRVNMANIEGTLTADKIIGGELSGITIDIGQGALKIGQDGWIRGAFGGFSVPPNADGVYNNYGGAARWKYNDSNYLYQNPSSFVVYLGGQAFRVDGGGAYVAEGDSLELLATRTWVLTQQIARFG